MFKRLFFLILLSVPALAFSGEEQIILKKALDSYRSGYLSASKHKAFAQSPEGAWQWVQEYASAEQAQKFALSKCNARVKPGQGYCVIINVDDIWINN